MREISDSPRDPAWYKDAIIYELHVRSFFDSNEDGIGDFRGLTEKLDYLQDLGVSALWLLPFYPSPLKDDGYDISDYRDVHPAYGTLHDLRTLLREAHRRGLKVITELVLNHTSDQHPWFQRARRSPPGSRWRNLYVWSDTPDRYPEARIIFKDFESSNWAWDPVAKAYYWHRFYSHQPDLNYDNPTVKSLMFRVIHFWLNLGVDGLRLDAVPYLYEREGTNCENLPETFAFLRDLRHYIDSHFSDRMLLAEANQWPEDAVAYFGRGDLCHMAFHFPLMPRMFMALQMEDRFPILEILEQTPPIPESCQWALFLRNHDELTLEMVTDEGRDYMYRSYAQEAQMRINLGIRRRLAPLLENDRRKVELMAGLLVSFQGTPVLYYGDEIGMGDNFFLGDRNGMRTPMQWSSDRNAGFSRTNPQRLFLPVIIDPEYHYMATNVEAQEKNPNSLLWWTKRLLSMKKRFKAFGRGSIRFLKADNRKILAFIRQFGDERVLIVANLSRYIEFVQIDLSEYKGMTPVEVFGEMAFPAVGELPYLLTLGPNGIYWFSLETARVPAEAGTQPAQAEPPVFQVAGSWETLLRSKDQAVLELALRLHLKRARWFGGKARAFRSARIGEILPLPAEESIAYIVLMQVEYLEGGAETYALPLAFASGEYCAQILREDPQRALVRLQMEGGEGILFDAFSDQGFAQALLETISRRRRRRGGQGEMVAMTTPALRHLRGSAVETLIATVLKAEQSNTSLIFGDRFILKLFRRLEGGTNPDLEIGRVLTDKGFPHTPHVAGWIEYRRERREPVTLAILQQFVPNQGDAWGYTLDLLNRYYENALAGVSGGQDLPGAEGDVLDSAGREIPSAVSDRIGPYLESARLLGRRTAQMHLALASVRDNPDFAPEPFSKLYQRSLYQSMRSQAVQTLLFVRQKLNTLPEEARGAAEGLLADEPRMLLRFHRILDLRMNALRIRCHGDYHLGQVLYTGKDFVIIDFEGEPARSISERRIKRSAFKDVAGMLRSFHYAAHTALRNQKSRAVIRPEDLPVMEPLADFWRAWVSAAFLQGYLETARSAEGIVPASRDELRVLLDVYLLEKAIYELAYEMNNRPAWVPIPIQGIQKLLGGAPQEPEGPAKGDGHAVPQG